VVTAAYVAKIFLSDLPPPHPTLSHRERVHPTRFLATDGIDRFARVAGYFLAQNVSTDTIELVDLGG
jgi:hypothetical protein